MKIKRQKMLDDFRDMIRLETVSNIDPDKVDRKAFAEFRQLLDARFPHVKAAAEKQLFGEGVLYHIPGKSDAAPSVLMSHYDVVPANAEEWDHPPFAAEVADGKVYGRGTLDTKGTLCAIMTAVDAALADGWQPKNDLYLSFGGEEEISGDCCPKIVAHLKAQGVRPAFVLDEGGAIVEGEMPAVKKRTAMIGVAEKGTVNYMLVLNGTAGHAASPPKHTTAGRMAKAACRIEEHPFPPRLSPAVRSMFRALSKEAPLYAKFAFANAGLLSPALAQAATKLGPTTNAMVRTTAAVVIIDCRSAFNVLPDRAAMGVNARLLAGDTIEGVAQQLKKIVNDPDIEVLTVSGSEPSPTSPTEGPAWELLCETIKEAWPGVLTIPFQMSGGTDARNYTEIAENIYRFSALEMDKAARDSVHGKNEAIAVDALYQLGYFYAKLIEKL